MTLTIDLPDEQSAALESRARAQGVSAEEYARQLLAQVIESGEVRQPMSEFMWEIWGDMPDDVRARLPRDGASQVDHYVYGLPKRDL
jgi:hypothetical protein